MERLKWPPRKNNMFEKKKKKNFGEYLLWA
jgi:hypothetical protein